MAGRARGASNTLRVGPGRINALVDGVFAIAVTLLVLDLPRPTGSAHLAKSLLDEWPAYVAYAVSFATVALVWIEHHGMMSAVLRVNRRFLELTLLLLAFVSLIPWPTAIAAAHGPEGGAAARTAAILYAGVMFLMAVAFTLSWRYLDAHETMVEEVARPALRGGARRSFLGACAYLPAILVALVSPTASFGIDAAVAVYFALSRTEVPWLVARSSKPEHAG